MDGRDRVADAEVEGDHPGIPRRRRTLGNNPFEIARLASDDTGTFADLNT